VANLVAMGVGALVVMRAKGAGRGLPVPGGPASYPLVASPHYSGRRGTAIDCIVLHYTAGAGEASSTARWFADPKSKVSAHYVVSRDGGIAQCVNVEQAAWHAGSATLAGSSDVNSRSIGIEICNRGLMTADGPGRFKMGDGSPYTGAATQATLKVSGAGDVTGFWEPYPGVQIDSVAALVEEIKHDFQIKHVVGHSEIAVPAGRKTDPGPLFPWYRVR